MDRRQALTFALAAAAASSAAWAGVPRTRPRLAITIDDFRPFDVGQMSRTRRNQLILDALDAHRIKAAGFPIARYASDAEGSTILDAWGAAGHIIGNHTWSHPNYAHAGYDTFSQDLLKADDALHGRPTFRKLLRFPYLSEGDTAEARDAMRRFLSTSGYSNASVTIDTSDWYVDQRLRTRLAQKPDQALEPYRRYYLRHLWDRATYYNDLLLSVTGKPGPHTILLHHTELNARFLDDALTMFSAAGWDLIDADDALRDPLFAQAPQSLPAGQSLAWALARQTGRFEGKLRFPGEDGDYEKPRMDELGL